MPVERVVAIHDFESDNLRKKLSFKKDDVLIVKTKLENGWWYGKIEKTAKMGYFSPKYMKTMTGERVASSNTNNPKCSSSEHSFHVARQMWCLLCDAFIDGTTRPGFKCESCLYTVHSKCKDQGLQSCDKEKAAQLINNSLNPLHNAIRSGDIGLVQQLISQGQNGENSEVDPTKKDRANQNALHIAATMGHMPLIEYLLQWSTNHKNGSKLYTTVDSNGWTPLHCAAVYGHFNPAIKLLDYISDVNVTSNDNTSVLHYLINHRFGPQLEQLLEKMREKGVNVNIMNKYSETALHRVAAKGSIGLCTWILKANPNVNLLNKLGETALHKASAVGHKDIVLLLLSAGADYRIEAHGVGTARDLAIAHKQIDIIDILDNPQSWEKELSKSVALNSQIAPDSPKIVQHSQNDINSETSNNNNKLEKNDNCLVTVPQGYLLEEAIVTSVTPAARLIDTDKYTPYYEHYFQKNAHRNFVGENCDIGPVLISLESKESSGAVFQQETEKLRALVRTKYLDEWCFIEATNEKKIKKFLKNSILSQSAYASKMSNIKIKEIGTKDNSSKVIDALAKMESRIMPKAYKFGVLYCKEGQENYEDEMFANVDTSQEFEEFLDFLGSRITLLGWDGYTGGLDVRSNTTGSSAIFGSRQGYSIMYHVSTLLPYYPDDLQQVERKRHIGNDVVVIIFKDSDKEPFNPAILKSQFNHVFFVFCVDKTKDVSRDPNDVYYKINVVYKDCSAACQPLLTQPDVYKRNAILRNTILTKFINAERTALAAPSFVTKTQRVKFEILKNFVGDYA